MGGGEGSGWCWGGGGEVARVGCNRCPVMVRGELQGEGVRGLHCIPFLFVVCG